MTEKIPPDVVNPPVSTDARRLRHNARFNKLVCPIHIASKVNRLEQTTCPDRLKNELQFEVVAQGMEQALRVKSKFKHCCPTGQSESSIHIIPGRRVSPEQGEEGVGLGVGAGVGFGVGTGVGIGVGTGVGLGVGIGVGTGVGEGVPPHPNTH